MRRTVFAKQVVGAANDELGDECTEFFKLGLALLAILIVRVGVATTDNRQLKVASEVGLAAEEVGVGKVEQREILGQIVLRGHDEHWPNST